eukprot:1158269-Pelagomonas_calceolata.AAC.3
MPDDDTQQSMPGFEAQRSSTHADDEHHGPGQHGSRQQGATSKTLARDSRSQKCSWHIQQKGRTGGFVPEQPTRGARAHTHTHTHTHTHLHQGVPVLRPEAVAAVQCTHNGVQCSDACALVRHSLLVQHERLRVSTFQRFSTALSPPSLQQQTH